MTSSMTRDSTEQTIIECLSRVVLGWQVGTCAKRSATERTQPYKNRSQLKLRCI